MHAQIDPEALSGGERVQLAALMLQAWGAFQAQSQHAETSQCGPLSLSPPINALTTEKVQPACMCPVHHASAC
jgi:hypothetical protein